MTKAQTPLTEEEKRKEAVTGMVKKTARMMPLFREVARTMAAVTTIMAVTFTAVSDKKPDRRAEALKFLADLREFQRQNYIKRTPFEKTRMSKRTQNVLKKAGFNSLVEVDKLSAEELLALPGVGKKRAMEILTEGTQNYLVRNYFIK